ncbi:MAG: PIN domain-containing protein [Gemmatimonadetes bacterium]|nr:PIN domain-containing protein [Gemmatimonadota bacterium]
MKILFDTNVVLDLLLDREPFSDTAARLFSRVDEGELSGFISATTVTTVHYLARRTVGDRRARREIQNLIDLLDVAPVNLAVLEGALQSKFADFEDAVLHFAALNVNAEGIVTRNAGDFKRSMIPVYAPDELDYLVQVTGERSSNG